MIRFAPRRPALRACLLCLGLVLASAFPGVLRAQAVAAAADRPTSPPLVLTPAEPGTQFVVEAPSGVIRIGDPVRLELRPLDERITPDRIEMVAYDETPEASDWMLEGAWEREFQPQRDGKPGLWHLVVRPFDTGELSLPPLTVTYRDAGDARQTAHVPAARLTVTSIRPPRPAGAAEQPAELIGLREPAPMPRDLDWIWQSIAILVALLVVMALLMRWWERRRLGPQGPAEPPLPPGLWALRELDRRSQLPICQTGPAKAVFTQVSEVIRQYLFRRYGVAASEMTTIETLHVLQARLQGDDEVLRWLQQFLEECDMAKFSPQEPPRGRWIAIWDDARLIVKMTTTNEELGAVGLEAKGGSAA